MACLKLAGGSAGLTVAESVVIFASSTAIGSAFLLHDTSIKKLITKRPKKALVLAFWLRIDFIILDLKWLLIIIVNCEL
ncbi:hypothetical protein D3C84_1161470 [compost metagenome]